MTDTAKSMIYSPLNNFRLKLAAWNEAYISRSAINDYFISHTATFGTKRKEKQYITLIFLSLPRNKNSFYRFRYILLMSIKRILKCINIISPFAGRCFSLLPAFSNHHRELRFQNFLLAKFENQLSSNRSGRWNLINNLNSPLSENI